MKKSFPTFISGLLATLLLAGCAEEHTGNLPESSKTFSQTDKEIGCESNLSDDQKEEIFDKNYKNHWVTWEGKVVNHNAEELSVDTNDSGTHNFTVKLEERNEGYDFTDGERVSVKFVLRRSGGCVLPFSGDHGSVL